MILSSIDFLFYSANKDLQTSIPELSGGEDVQIVFLNDFDAVLETIDKKPIKFVFVDIDDESLKPLQLLEWLKTCHLPCRTGVITDKTYGQEFTNALRLGVKEVFSVSKLDNPEYGIQRIKKWLADYELWHSQVSRGKITDKQWVGRSPKQRLVYEDLLSAIQAGQHVLLSGEHGVGKRYLVEAAIGDIPYVDASLPDYEHMPAFKKALEQIRELVSPLLLVHDVTQLHAEVQEAIAELIKDGEWKSEQVNVQIIATTASDLQAEVQSGTFRQDLFSLIHTDLHIPALRLCKEDVPWLTEYYLNQGDQYHFLSADAMVTMMQYTWPGNVKELREVLVEMTNLSEGAMITAKSLPPKLLKFGFYAQQEEDDWLEMPYKEAKKRVLNKFNRTYIEDLIIKSERNLTVAAEKADMDRSNFKKIVKKYGLE
jgi:DNA-binding NtrC family response regulator